MHHGIVIVVKFHRVLGRLRVAKHRSGQRRLPGALAFEGNGEPSAKVAAHAVLLGDAFHAPVVRKQGDGEFVVVAVELHGVPRRVVKICTPAFGLPVLVAAAATATHAHGTHV